MDHIGIDVHKKDSQICILAEGGELLEPRNRTELERFTAVFGARPRGRIVLETSTDSEWMARCLEGLGHEVIVADPNFAPMYATRTRKVKMRHLNRQLTYSDETMEHIAVHDTFQLEDGSHMESCRNGILRARMRESSGYAGPANSSAKSALLYAQCAKAVVQNLSGESGYCTPGNARQPGQYPGGRSCGHCCALL